jgi:hypothetical protein
LKVFEGFMALWVGKLVSGGAKGESWVLDLDQVSIQVPGREYYGYIAREGIFMHCGVYTPWCL